MVHLTHSHSTYLYYLHCLDELFCFVQFRREGGRRAVVFCQSFLAGAVVVVTASFIVVGPIFGTKSHSVQRRDPFRRHRSVSSQEPGSTQMSR